MQSKNRIEESPFGLVPWKNVNLPKLSMFLTLKKFPTISFVAFAYCGHIACFWCVHKSMNSQKESHCPICRNPYAHFPGICQTLHFLLLKLYPIAYKKREVQTLEEEKRVGYFSPEFNDHKCKPRACTNEEKDRISAADLLCTACKQLLFRPIVLNCGHIYCQTCIIFPANEMLRCPFCQCLCPSSFPKICLTLDQFLAAQFPNEYSLRKASSKHDRATTCSVESSKLDFKPLELPSSGRLPSSVQASSYKHVGVGCDACGMSPIIGDRYECIDCTEKIGFDLCGDCYSTRPKLPGRFNQRHTPEHRFERLQSSDSNALPWWQNLYSASGSSCKDGSVIWSEEYVYACILYVFARVCVYKNKISSI
ncbi:E3 ubiquitin-protein ligase PRT1-like [Hibiscus syriacus]|uniref:E3 ubiquitin-protein ligase PRT1-like n=1 Tax=Hibiscus syriacus TaxID=106335 RepID=UPI0019245E54|nr:E3 ubiquitin-protein ligase PRT1-like [Hibiscus syriacus]